MSDIEKKGREKVIDWSRDVEAGDSPGERRSGGDQAQDREEDREAPGCPQARDGLEK